MTERARHTPGPWKLYHALLRPQFPGATIIEVQDLDGGAVVQWSGFDNSDRLKKTHLANARLIAAAPDLLDALLKCKHGAEYPDELGDIIDAALARTR